MDQKQWRQKFLEEVLKLEDLKKETHYNVLTKDKYSQLILEVEMAESAEKRTPMQQRRLHRFGVLSIGNVKKLISRSEETVKHYLTVDELYDVIDAAHVAVGHGGRDRLLAETSKKFANITKQMIILYLSMCETCQQKKTKKKRGLVSKPILHSEMNSRCQVDLIDFQSQPDEKFKFIMVYQDHLTKFLLLRPLESKRAEEVAYHLNDIFLTFGAPCILQSDNGREFVNKVITELTSLWSELKIVHGKPRHSQSQGSVERANQDVENMIAVWLKDNNSTKWSEGLRYVQFMKNRALHSGIKQSPYKAMFGIEPRVGLKTTSLPAESIENINDEEDLLKLVEQEVTNQEDENTNNQVIYENDDTEENENHDTDSPTSEHIENARKRAQENLQKQAKRMKLFSDKLHKPANVGDNVTMPIPDVDKGRGELRNIIGIILQVTDDGLYKIGTKHGILQNFYAR